MKALKTFPVVCLYCKRGFEMPPNIADFWQKNTDVPYVCESCMKVRVHDAVLACDILKLEADTAAIKLSSHALNLPPLPRP